MAIRKRIGPARRIGDLQFTPDLPTLGLCGDRNGIENGQIRRHFERVGKRPLLRVGHDDANGSFVFIDTQTGGGFGNRNRECDGFARGRHGPGQFAFRFHAQPRSVRLHSIGQRAHRFARLTTRDR